MEKKNNKIPTILNYANLNFDNFEYFYPQKIKQDNLFSLTSYNLSKTKIVPLYLETPILKILSTIIEINDEYFIDVELPLKGKNTNFYDFVSNVDEKNVLTSYHNSSDWFSQSIPLETIKEYYDPSVKIDEQLHIPKLRLKIPTYNNKLLLEVYNKNKTLITHDKLEKNDNFIAIIRYVGLKFESKKFIPEWEIYKIKLLKVENKETLPIGYIFSDKDNEVIKEEPKEEVKQVEPEVIKEEPEEVKQVKPEVIKEEPEEVKQVEPEVIKEEPKEVEKIVDNNKTSEIKIVENVLNKVINEQENDDEEEDYNFEDSEYELEDLELNEFDYENEKKKKGKKETKIKKIIR